MNIPVGPVLLALTTAAVFVSLVAAQTVVQGYVVATLWGWFVVHAFPIAPVLSIPQATGCLLVLVAIRGYTHRTPPRPDTTAEKWVRWLGPYVIPLLALVVGWLVRRWL